MAGLDSTGLDIKRLNDVISDLGTKLQDAFGATTNVSEDSVFGQLIGVIAPEISSVWELTQGVYDGFIPSSAEFTQLDNVFSYIGGERIGASSSTVTALVTGDPGTIIPTGSIASVDGTGDQFNSSAEKTLSLASATSVLVTVSTVLDSTPYSIFINGVASTYNSGIGATNLTIATGLVNALLSSSEPITPVDNNNGTLTINSDTDLITFVTSLSAGLTTTKITDTLAMASVTTGPVLAPASTLNQIDTPVFGWDSVTNPVAATLGRDIETDTEMRLRRERSLQISGSKTAGAIQAQVAQVDGVTSAVIFENDTEVTVDGRPPHSFEVVAEGGVDEDIGQAIFDVKPIGIQSVGNTSPVVEDSQGLPVVSKFSRPTPIYVHVQVDYTKYTEEVFPDPGGETLIASTVLAYGQSLGIGKDVIPNRFVGPIHVAVPGIEELVITIATSVTEFGAPGAFSSNPLPISSIERSDFNSARISVTEV